MSFIGIPKFFFLNVMCLLVRVLGYSCRRKGDVLMSGVAEADALDAAAERCHAVAMRKPIDRARIVDHITAALGATP